MSPGERREEGRKNSEECGENGWSETITSTHPHIASMEYNNYTCTPPLSPLPFLTRHEMKRIKQACPSDLFINT